MSAAKIDQRFFESTRGRIVTLLRGKSLTVNDLAKELGLTDNAIRAHLLSLERDGLVVQQGMIKGVRKPHFIYGLSENARALFPLAYDVLFSRLISSLKSSLSKASLLARLRDVGRRIGLENKLEAGRDPAARVEKALSVIESLGGSAVVAVENGETVIRSGGCPFSVAVSEHPEVCKITESVISEILEAEVSERCDRQASPKCKFVVQG